MPGIQSRRSVDCRAIRRERVINAAPTPLPPGARLQRDPLAAVAVPLAPIVLEGRYRLLVGALWRLGRSRRGQWALATGSGALVVALALLAARHFATTSWPLAKGDPGLLVAAGLLLLLAQALKAYGWGRLFTPDERPKVLALAAGNGGAALIGVVLPGRFDDAMRVAVVRRYPGCPAGVRALCLSLVMLGLIDSVALAPLAFAAALFPGAGMAMRAALVVVAAAGVAAAALILVLPRLAGSSRVLRFRLGRWLGPRTTSRRAAAQAWALVSACWLVRAVALFLLLGTLGVGFSFPLALLFLCAGAAAAALRARPRRWAPAAPPSSPRASEPRRRSLSPSRSELSGSSPGPRSCFSPWRGALACRWCRRWRVMDPTHAGARLSHFVGRPFVGSDAEQLAASPTVRQDRGYGVTSALALVVEAVEALALPLRL
jgi:hypothetical protein